VLKDLTGQRFGRLEVIGRAGANKSGNAQWLCRCKCGAEKVIEGSNLRSGNTQSCRCLRIEKSKTHGHACKGNETFLYTKWQNMKARCNNTKGNKYKDYGGRGIRVCDRWLTFENFLSDMGYPPTKKHTLERIDVNGDYEPSNCRWATHLEQAQNKRDSRFLCFNGQRLVISEWAKITGIAYGTIRRRLESGWSAEKTLTTPVDSRCWHSKKHTTSEFNPYSLFT
jgi:hypothetical protein